jgi:hypothetical protein
MDELFKALRHFIARDLVFVIGGGTVLAAALYTFGKLPDGDEPFLLYLLAVGIAHAVGYALQDGFSLTGLTTVTPPRKLIRPLRWFFERFTGDKWEDIEDEIDLQGARDRIKEERDIANFERIINLGQVGTTMTPSSLATAVFMVFRACDSGSRFDWFLVGAASVLAVVFLILAWIKAAQQTQYIIRFVEPASNESRDRPSADA